MTKKLSVELNQYFFAEARQPQVKIGDVLSLAGDSVFGLLFVLLALPSALPLPAPGYSIPFGLAILPLALQLALGREQPWLPPRFVNGALSLERAQGFLKAGTPWLRRLEAIAKPRFSHLCTNPAGRAVLGGVIALMATSMLIPIPGTNTLPAIAIFLIGFGLVEDDGLICLFGLFCALLYLVLLTIAIILFVQTGANFYNILKDWIKSLV
ncbi:MAG: exopolysaccharide biosynthesis protein [Spirulinaceae cyanobacterium SM2_1_0]|nr:exopolysaccharide biosynthesis protein [Spirulinaceae cyanobacterium SM2_1_0]